MNPIFKRTIRDQLGWRTLAFTLALVGFALASVFVPTGEIDSRVILPGDADGFANQQNDRDTYDANLAWAWMFGLPVLNAGLVLLLFALFAGVTATAGEWGRRTHLLLFSKPRKPSEIFLQKTLGASVPPAAGLAVMFLVFLIACAIADVPVTGGVFLAWLWTAIAIVPVVAIAATVGIWIRKSIPSIGAGVVVLLLLAPLVGGSGFLATMQTDFRDEGIYTGQLDAEVSACGSMDVHFNAMFSGEANNKTYRDEALIQAQNTYTSIDVCREDAVGHVDAFYEGKAPRKWYQYEQKFCQVETAYASKEGNPIERNCNESAAADRDDVFAQKFDTWRIDGTRYLQPVQWLGWQPVVDFSPIGHPNRYADDMSSNLWAIAYPDNALGGIASPNNALAASFALLIHVVAWPALGALIISRQDLS